ncbi:MAG TPA: ATP-binding protein [Nitrospiria bacterium]|nr:ATP-binding protein [Nitrospiria bacterium]
MFEDIFKTENPSETDSFQQLLQGIGSESGPQSLRRFLIRFNEELQRKARAAGEERSGWAQDLLCRLLNTHPKIMIETLNGLMEEMELNYYDPLIELIFETSPQAPPFFSFLSDLVKMENQLLQFRVRTLEAFFMKRSSGDEPHPITAGAENVLHFLNEILYDLKMGSSPGAHELLKRLSDRFKTIRKLLSDADVRDRHRGGGEDHPSHDGGLSLEGYFKVLGLIQGAMERLAVHSKDAEATRGVLEVLKANSPVPVWYPAVITAGAWELLPADGGDGFQEGLRSAGGFADAAAQQGGANDRSRNDAAAILGLVIDKVVKVILAVALAAWRSETHPVGKPRTKETVRLTSTDPSVLELLLLDQSAAPKTRNMAAGLLRVLRFAFPSTRISPRAEFYSDLFLIPAHPGLAESSGRGEFFSIIEAPEKIAMLLEAFDQTSDYVRWKASETCYRTAMNHPDWFTQQHQIRLLSLLMDPHAGVRSNVTRTFRVLAEHRNEGMVKVVRDISERLSGDPRRTESQERAHRDLEAALAVIFDGLMQRVDGLQQEVQGLETQRRALLDQIEGQAMRIGEEIHHEILNTRCGYLATSIDEERYKEAKEDLEELAADLRRIMNNLYPKDLETEGFLATIRKRLEDAGRQMRRRAPDFAVKFECSDEITNQAILDSLRDRSHVVLLYRILLEAIVDARKHAHGTFIRVRFQRSDGGPIDIAVVDDGRGDGGPFQENVGLALMRQRAKEIGAEIEYQRTSPRGGTTVVVRLPR